MGNFEFTIFCGHFKADTSIADGNLKVNRMIEHPPMAEGDESEPTDSPAEEQAETASIPQSLLGGKTVQPGDVIRLRVISVDADNGSINVEYAHDKPQPKNTQALADEYDQPQPEE